MGEVRRVLDRDLGCRLAMKIAKPERMQRARSLSRFIEEAQIGVQLQHPGLVPVHEIGHLPDGRLYFTMREVKERDFSKVIREVHSASQENL